MLHLSRQPLHQQPYSFVGGRHQGAKARIPIPVSIPASSSSKSNSSPNFQSSTLPSGWIDLSCRPPPASRRTTHHPHPRGRRGPIATAAACSTRCSPSSAFVAIADPALRRRRLCRAVTPLLEEDDHCSPGKVQHHRLRRHQRRGQRQRGRPGYRREVAGDPVRSSPTGRDQRRFRLRRAPGGVMQYDTDCCGAQPATHALHSHDPSTKAPAS